MGRKVIILGTDHYNAIGLVQSLGRAGLQDIIAIVVGKAKLISRSVYLSACYEVDSFQSAIDFIVKRFQDDTCPSVIIPSGDPAALYLEDNRGRLSKFLFQHVKGGTPIARLMDKQVQSELAKESGFSVPESIEVSSIDDSRLNQVSFPCIVKPYRSTDGDKKDITIVSDFVELITVLPGLLERAPKLVVQRYINAKEKELNILGCCFSDGSICVPMGIEKTRIYPIGSGSVAACVVFPFSEQDRDIIRCISNYMSRIDYVGLFSFEIIVEQSTHDYYFVELNLRNDALSPFVEKSGVNLPYLHYIDLIDELIDIPTPHIIRRKMVCEPVHISALYHNSLSFNTWVNDLLGARFILSDKKDWRLFMFSFVDRLLSRKTLSFKHKN